MNEMFDLNKDLLLDKKNPAKILTGSELDNLMDGELPGALPIFG